MLAGVSDIFPFAERIRARVAASVLFNIVHLLLGMVAIVAVRASVLAEFVLRRLKGLMGSAIAGLRWVPHLIPVGGMGRCGAGEMLGGTQLSRGPPGAMASGMGRCESINALSHLFLPRAVLAPVPFPAEPGIEPRRLQRRPGARFA